MALLLNAAGDSAANPILKGLPIELGFYASSIDLSTITDVWLDQVNTFPGVNSIKSSLVPPATNVVSGIAGTYDDTTKTYSLPGITGLVAGDYVFLSHGALTAGPFEVLTNPTSGSLTFVSNPLNSLGNKTGISYQVAWSYENAAGSTPMVSSAAGTQNYFKIRGADGGGASTDLLESLWIRDLPTADGKGVSVGGLAGTGGTVSVLTPSFDFLTDWLNGSSVKTRGGVSHVRFANHSGSGTNDFKWGDDSVTEKTIGAAISGGFKLTATDGLKRGRLIFSAYPGGAGLGYDIDTTLDTAGPTIVAFIKGRR